MKVFLFMFATQNVYFKKPVFVVSALANFSFCHESFKILLQILFTASDAHGTLSLTII